eukprot:357516-Chlamydomonas_euryale.AAC.20
MLHDAGMPTNCQLATDCALQVRGNACSLGPGDVLYVPPYWSIHTELLMPADGDVGVVGNCDSGNKCATADGDSGCGRRHAALRLMLSQRPGMQSHVPSPGALLMQASRAIEAQAGEELAPAGVRGMLITQARVMSQHAAEEAAWLRACIQSGPQDAFGACGCAAADDSSRAGVGALMSMPARPEHWLPRLLRRDRELWLQCAPGAVRSYRLARLAQGIADACTTAAAAGHAGALAARLASSTAVQQGCCRCSSRCRYACHGCVGTCSSSDGRAVVATSGNAEWASTTACMLAVMCDGRLLPTPWLNAYGDAADAGLMELSHRLEYSYQAPQLTHEEAAFPQLFRTAIATKERDAADAARRTHLERGTQLLSMPGHGAPALTFRAAAPEHHGQSDLDGSTAGH